MKDKTKRNLKEDMGSVFKTAYKPALSKDMIKYITQDTDILNEKFSTKEYNVKFVLEDIEEDKNYRTFDKKDIELLEYIKEQGVEYMQLELY